jgi:hypothetical protein
VKAHDLKHLLSEVLLLGALVFPFALGLASLTGLASWIIAGTDAVLSASGIVWCATMIVVPIALRISCGPDTRVMCDHCTTRKPGRPNHVFGRNIMEQRKHTRHQVEFPGDFSGDDISGSGIVMDLSTGGCRVRSKVTTAAGDFIGLLISLPGHPAPLKVSLAAVRWSIGNEFGMEFIRMDPEDQGLLRLLIGKIGADVAGEGEQVFG